MHTFDSLAAAIEAGYHWDSFDSEYNLHVVVRTRRRADHKLERMRAFARPGVPALTNALP